MSFIKRYQHILKKNDSLMCMGIDPNPDRFPQRFKRSQTALFDFCRAMIDATAHDVCAFKFQIAYFSAIGAEKELESLIEYVQNHYPEVLIILDSKRGDIGATAEQYAQEAFVRYEADAVTVNPYMGLDSVEPFLNHSDKGVFILCRTSNVGGADLQELQVSTGRKLYEEVAWKAAYEWNEHRNAMLVVGATHPEPLARVRAIIGDKMPLLVPGIGAQGGDIESVINDGGNTLGEALLINVSRSVLYASEQDDFLEAAQQSLLKVKQTVNDYRYQKRDRGEA